MAKGVSSEILASVKEIPCTISAGKYTVKLAETAEELQQTQELRARIFFKHLTDEQLKSAETRDYYAHHLIVVYHSDEGDKVVGTLRLINSDYLPESQKFYSEEYFQFNELLKANQHCLELSRFCIEEKFRKGSILLLIWKSAMAYINHVKVDMMFGISSFPGQDPKEHADVLSLLYQEYLADKKVMPEPIQDAHPIKELIIDEVAKERQLPTLVRGYLKMGGKISDHYYIDPVFNTTFVFLYVEFETFKSYVEKRGKG